MKDQEMQTKSGFHSLRPDTLEWKLYLAYDIFMMLIIVINLICISSNAFLMSHLASWMCEQLHLTHLLQFYKTELNPWVTKTENWFIVFLVAELLIRWGIAIVQRHHQRWFFFPFIHWYEVLAIHPYLRFLRLIRAGIIAYRLHEIGYNVIPEGLMKQLHFYYHVIMEELSDRVVITVIDSVKTELDTSSTHKKIIHDLVDHHREMFAVTLAEILQESLATELKAQQKIISDNVGQVVVQAIEDTPELTQLLRLIPIVGGRIEQQIHSIGQRLGENITQGLITPFTMGSSTHPNTQYTLIAQKIGQINIDNQSLEQLVESIVYESLESLRRQVAVKQWQLKLEKNDQLKQ